MTRVAWFQCAAGVAGDMAMASLVDAGADQFFVMNELGALDVDGWALTFERVQRCGVSATWANVVVHDHDGEHAHRPASNVLDLIDRSSLTPRVKARSLRVYETLAQVEALIHGVPADSVELHEVGALDSIIDIVGTCAALESLRIDEVRYSPIGVGHGVVRTAHGDLPNPSPAVTRLFAQHGSRSFGVDTTMEIATPTGVALLTTLSAADGCGPMPSMAITSTGFGAGTADTADRPNVLQTVIGDADDQASSEGQRAFEVAVNVDDVSGEVLAHAVSELLRVGAFDAWVTPIVMKKGRPAHTVHALCDDAHHEPVRSIMLATTGSLGIRSHEVRRWPQQRDEFTVTVDGFEIRIKQSEFRTKVEFDDAAEVAARTGKSVREVLALAEHLASVYDRPPSNS